jgi:hypothetical protein
MNREPTDRPRPVLESLSFQGREDVNSQHRRAFATTAPWPSAKPAWAEHPLTVRSRENLAAVVAALDKQQ